VDILDFISEFYSLAENDEDEDWKAIINYLRESIKDCIPIKHVPFRMHIPPRIIHRNVWLSFISGLQIKYKEIKLNSYKDIFQKEDDFTSNNQIASKCNKKIKENVDNIIRSEAKLTELLDKYDLEFHFKMKIRQNFF